MGDQGVIQHTVIDEAPGVGRHFGGGASTVAADSGGGESGNW